MERPTVLDATLGLANIDALQVFEGGAAPGAFGLRDRPPGGARVHISGEPGLLSPRLPQKTLGGPGTLGLVPCPDSGITISQAVQVSDGISIPSRAKPGVAHPFAGLLQCVHAQGRDRRAQAALPRQGQAGMARADRRTLPPGGAVGPRGGPERQNFEQGENPCRHLRLHPHPGPPCGTACPEPLRPLQAQAEGREAYAGAKPGYRPWDERLQGSWNCVARIHRRAGPVHLAPSVCSCALAEKVAVRQRGCPAVQAGRGLVRDSAP